MEMYYSSGPNNCQWLESFTTDARDRAVKLSLQEIEMSVNVHDMRDIFVHAKRPKGTGSA